METIRQRYLPEQCIQQQPLGKLYKGKDLFFNRDVMCFVLEPADEATISKYVQSIRRVSQFSDERFMHVLDIDVNPDRIMAILKPGAGRLIIDELKTHKFGGIDIIRLVRDLGYGMHEAKKEGITDFSVRADNLCLNNEYGLSVINYWEIAEPRWCGAPGLCRLLYQLAFRTFETPEDPDALCGKLREAFGELDAEQADDIAGRVRRVLGGEAALPHLLSGLDNIVSRHEGRKAPPTPVQTAPSKKPAPMKTPSPNPEAKAVKKRFEWNRKWVIGCSVLILLLAGEMSLLRLIKKTDIRSESATVQKQDTFTASEQPAGPKLQKPPAQATDASTNEETVSTPALTGHSREEAEKQAIANGLRYQYFIEPHDQLKDTVFKQDPAPNVSVPKGSQITFWVSKGK